MRVNEVMAVHGEKYYDRDWRVYRDRGYQKFLTYKENVRLHRRKQNKYAKEILFILVFSA